jgi:hypothetical protein
MQKADMQKADGQKADMSKSRQSKSRSVKKPICKNLILYPISLPSKNSKNSIFNTMQGRKRTF